MKVKFVGGASAFNLPESRNRRQMRTPIAAVVAMLSSTMLAASPVLCLAQAHPTPARDESTKAIRATAYNLMKAFLTQDVATFKRNAAKRTLELVSLTYEAARQDPRYQPELEKAHIANADQFLGYFMLGLANQYMQTVPMPPEAAARRVANESTVSFVTDSEARIIVGDSEFARARRVAGNWKIDLTDSLKKAVLKEVTSPELRARIKSL